jgi:hypothetical protein
MTMCGHEWSALETSAKRNETIVARLMAEIMKQPRGNNSHISQHNVT